MAGVREGDVGGGSGLVGGFGKEPAAVRAVEGVDVRRQPGGAFAQQAMESDDVAGGVPAQDELVTGAVFEGPAVACARSGHRGVGHAISQKPSIIRPVMAATCTSSVVRCFIQSPEGRATEQEPSEGEQAEEDGEEGG